MTDTPAKMTEINVVSDKNEVCKICQQILCQLRSCDYNEDDVFGVHLALEEALINAVKHGNSSDRSKKVHIKYMITCEKVEVVVEDEGPGFVPEQVPDPRSGSNLCKPGGRGVLLMNAYMDQVEFNKKGNQVHMIKRRSS